MMSRIFFSLLFGTCLIIDTALGQVREATSEKREAIKDSLRTAESHEIVVTATRTEQELENVAIPVSVISEKNESSNKARCV
jgi:outer membrane cobalamin receptor